jgi:hypothetical protein
MRPEVLLGRVLRQAGKLGPARGEGLERRLDGDLVVAHAQARPCRAIVQAIGRIGRGHHHRAHLVGPQGIHGNGQGQGRIDAARQADQAPGKPFLPM